MPAMSGEEQTLDDKVWEKFDDLDDRVSAIDKTLGVVSTEIHGMKAGFAELTKVVRDFARELTASKSPNWAAYGVIIPVVLTLGSVISFVGYREIEHVNHIHNLKYSHREEVVDL